MTTAQQVPEQIPHKVYVALTYEERQQLAERAWANKRRPADEAGMIIASELRRLLNERALKPAEETPA